LRQSHASQAPSRLPDAFNLSSTDTLIRSPALNAPSSESALPRRQEGPAGYGRTCVPAQQLEVGQGPLLVWMTRQLFSRKQINVRATPNCGSVREAILLD
jgi:hypothetical protein